MAGAPQNDRLIPRAVDRVRAAPLTLHAGALALLLLALLPLVGWRSSYSADEGAAIVQAQNLSRGDGWIVAHPLPEVDAEGRWYPLELTSKGPLGHAPYAKHPLYPLLLAGADRVGGPMAMVLLSVTGTWLAALSAAVLAGDALGGHRRSALWLAGIGSPLLFNGYWVIAHSLAAAAAGWATVLLLRALRGELQLPDPAVAAAPALTLLGAMLRTEGALFALALGAVGTVAAVLLRRGSALALSLAVGATGLAARWFDAQMLERIVGSPAGGVPAFAARSRGGGLEDRVDALVTTWLRPNAPGGDDLITVVTVMGVLLLLVLLVQGRPARGPALAAGGTGAAILLVRAGLDPAPIPGLLIAFPVLAALAWAPTALAEGDRGLRVIAAVVALTWALVAATQYAEGGVAEWGGRYFAIGLPLAVPVVLAGLACGLRGLSVPTRRRSLAILAVGILALSAGSLRELRDVRGQTSLALDTVHRAAETAGPSAVIVTDLPLLPRLDWERFDRHRWLLLDPTAEPQLPGTLADAGIDRWVLASTDLAAGLASFEDVVVVDRMADYVAVVEYRPT